MRGVGGHASGVREFAQVGADGSCAGILGEIVALGISEHWDVVGPRDTDDVFAKHVREGFLGIVRQNDG